MRRTAFTLVEVTISLAVLTMLITFVAQLVNSTTIVTTKSRKHMNADSQARLVFDRMAGDFARIVHRSDVDYVFSKQAGTTRCSFTASTSLLRRRLDGV